MNTIRNYTTLYHTYFLLYYKQQIHITYNHTNIKVEIKQYSKQGKRYLIKYIYKLYYLISYLPAIIL